MQIKDYVMQEEDGLYASIPVNQEIAGFQVTAIDMAVIVEDGEVVSSDISVGFEPTDDDHPYGDDSFVEGVRNYLISIGVGSDVVADINYSEGGMQTDEYAHFDASELGNFIASL
jgi:hypothetical protein